MKTKTLFFIICLFSSLGLRAKPIVENACDTLIAEFAATATDGCAGIEIQFYDQSIGNINTLNWTFNGGIPATSQEATPFVVFPDSGVFQVVLEVSDGLNIALDSAAIQVRSPKPIVQYSFENNGLEVSFTNTSTGSSNYLWDFGDDTFSTEYSPQHTYAQEGLYVIRLRATNDCKAVIKSEVLILDFDLQPITYTANDVAHPYDGPFRPGVNLGYFPPWTDATLADIAAGNPDKGVRGAGIKVIRPALFEHFLEEYDYDIRQATFKHYDSLGLEDNTVIIGFPSDEHRDTSHYCPEERSELFANLYTDIWDNGENGTPVNDENYYALYLWKMVNMYKDETRFWEVWNEPGFDYTFVTGYLPPGTPNNWWDNNPDPCDYKLRAPIFHYIRLLRISFEVIKTIDPDSYVTLASVGFPAFLDAILRNTDNPADGSVQTDYPEKGGAYFDAIGIHSYPHFDGTLRKWDDNIQDFIYSRHTDKAITSISVAKDTFEYLLGQYGYDGQQYPQKEWVITETNLPRKAFTADSYGSEEVQINFILKAYIESVRNDIRQMHVFDMSESHTFETAISEFQLMGLYKVLFGIFPYGQEINNIGIAYRGISELFYGATYDTDRSAALQLPSSLDGAAFLDRNGHYHYILWVKTLEDLSEDVTGLYSFPTDWNISVLQKRQWDYTESGVVELFGAQDIALDGRPIFLTDTVNTFLVAPTAGFDFEVEDFCIPATVRFSDQSSTNVTAWNWTFPGGNPATSTEANPVVVYDQAGTYDATLEVSNAAGNSIKQKTDLFIIANISPIASFSSQVFDKMVSFNNTSQNATAYLWDLGDNNVSTEANPHHNYPVPGIYQVVLNAINGCDTSIATQTIIINPEQINPIPNFTVSRQAGCPGMTVQFFNQSSVNATDFFWLFLNGEPGFSTEENPIVTYNSVGQHAVSLQASNVAGSLAIFRDSFILVEEAPLANFELEQIEATIHLTNLSSGAYAYLWDFGDGNTSTAVNPIYTYTQGGVFNVVLKAINNCDTVTQALEITVEAIPTAAFNANTLEGCPPFEVTFTDETTGNATFRKWEFPGGTPTESTEATPLVNYTTAGSYSVRLIVGNATGNDTLERVDYILGLSPAKAGFNYTVMEAEVQFSNSSTFADANSFQWDFGDGNTGNVSDPIHTYAHSGSYEVRLIASNNCNQDTSIQTLEIIIDGIEELLLPGDIRVFPNPNNGQFTLLLQSEPVGEIALRIFSIFGQEVYREKINLTSGLFSKNYHFNHWAPGTYFLQLRNGKYSYQSKIILGQ